MSFKKGDQIIYIPSHANGNINHPDCEPGFVVGTKTHTAFCRYWREPKIGLLRNTKYSEATPVSCLKKHNSVDQRIVDLWLNENGY